MRTNDPQLASMAFFGTTAGSIYAGQQHTGVYLAIVSDTHSNNSQIPQGTVAFTIPHLGNFKGWTPAPYPGRHDPPIGTECVVAFEGQMSDAPRVT